MALRMNNLEMPPSFPEEQFERIYQIIDRFREHGNHHQFQGAWNAVAYRYTAMVDYSDGFTSSILKNGPGVGEPVRYGQERDLFGFASNAYSMLEATHYATYAVGSFLDDTHFRLSNDRDERNVSFGGTKRAFAAVFGLDPINQHFSSFYDDPARRDLDAMRNMLTHRASPPRAFRLTIGGGNARPSASFTRLKVEINDQTTAVRLTESRRLLIMCLDALEQFIGRH